jgi:osmotically-inducible protein OsmY
MNNENDKDSHYSFKQTHSGRSPFPSGEWGESSEFAHENESLNEFNRSRFADTLLSSDEKIREDILEALNASPIVEASDLKVSVVNGVVILGGVVRTTAIREEAQKLAESVSGIVNIQNGIRLGGNL